MMDIKKAVEDAFNELEMGKWRKLQGSKRGDVVVIEGRPWVVEDCCGERYTVCNEITGEVKVVTVTAKGLPMSS